MGKVQGASERKLIQLAVVSPCTVSWAGMAGGEKIRHCGDCRKNVYNLSAMSEAEVEQLIARGEDQCIRYYYRSDGTIVPSNCSDGSYRAPSKLAIGVAASMASAVAFAGFGAIVDGAHRPESLGQAEEANEVRVAMGGIRIHPRTPRIQGDLVEQVQSDRPDVAPALRAEVAPTLESELAPITESELAPTMPPDETMGESASPTSGGQGLPVIPLGLSFLSLLGFLVARRGLPQRRLQKFDAWSIPQLATVASACSLACVSGVWLQAAGSLVFGAALALSIIVQRAR